MTTGDWKATGSRLQQGLYGSDGHTTGFDRSLIWRHGLDMFA